ncbi:MAG: AmmeMemoRadiSam system protein B [Deltaproteobacteria bacterium]|nr:AmmeMemoRadiSam system protein B [Deltaproteobacteria bacterium]MBW2356148.1 AmmeMemoRadiSam system protein B [Deltaproteobacteria bacterium]RLB95879.1 MAG: AmmeMemoRadiSam system protein B [Deltaproteobacteria bacterium]
MNVRKPILAGSWYPATADECRRQIETFLRDPVIKPPAPGRRVGGIVPHAGWAYSGAVACNVIRYLAEGEPPDTVVVYGMHLPPEGANHIMAEGGWETPLGVLEIDAELAGELTAEFSFVVETARRFVQDNTIELQLPFIRHFFGDAKLLPLGVPPAKATIALARRVAAVAAALGRRIKVLGSTDLTHYGLNYGFAPRGIGPESLAWVRDENDRRIVDAMLRLEPETVISEALARHNACCAGAAAAAIETGRRLGADAAHLLAYTTSHEKSPGPSFVGYAGLIF